MLARRGGSCLDPFDRYLPAAIASHQALPANAGPSARLTPCFCATRLAVRLRERIHQRPSQCRNQARLALPSKSLVIEISTSHRHANETQFPLRKFFAAPLTTRPENRRSQ